MAVTPWLADEEEEAPADGAPWCRVSDDTGGLDRVAANELLFVRLAKRTMTQRDSADVPFADFACECGNDACDLRIPMTAAQYEPIRSSAARFAIAPRDEHVSADTETVVEWQQFYWVVERTLNAELVEFFSSGRQRTGAHLSLVPPPEAVPDEVGAALTPRLAVLPSTREADERQ